MGPIEIEYEGSEEFLKGELLGLLTAISSLYKQSGLVSNSEPSKLGAKTTPPGNPTKLQLTTASIAAKLSSKSGSDLVLAACTRLTFVSGQDLCTRNQINDEMKAATGYYKTSYTSNLSNYLQTLVKEQKLNEQAADTYALTPDTKTDLEKRLHLGN